MAISYKRLWKLLIDKDLKKKDLESITGISHYTMNRLNKGENVTIGVLEKICQSLNCSIEDVVEIIPEDKTV